MSKSRKRLALTGASLALLAALLFGAHLGGFDFFGLIPASGGAGNDSGHMDVLSRSAHQSASEDVDAADKSNAASKRDSESSELTEAERRELLNNQQRGGGKGSSAGGSGDGSGDSESDDPDASEDQTAAKEEGVEEEEESEEELFDENQQINPFLLGRLERADKREIRGYVYDKSEPEAAIIVQVEIDSEIAYTLSATKREEHKTLGTIWRFKHEKPEELLDDQYHRIRAFATRKDRPGRKELEWSNRQIQPNVYPRGKVEEVSYEKGISGYAWDPNNVRKPLEIVIEVDGQDLSKTTANLKNEEVKKRGISGWDKVGFKAALPAHLDNGQPHTVRILAVDNDTKERKELEGSPRVLTGMGGRSDQPPVGRFDIANNSVLAGYAYDMDAPETPIDVEIYINGKFHIRINASSPRHSLKSSRVTPNEYHGWLLPTPAEIRDGNTHTIRVYAMNEPLSSGVKVELSNSPYHYRSEDNDVPMGGFWRADEKMLRGWAVDPDLDHAPCEIEIYIDKKLWKRTVADRAESWMDGVGYAPNNKHGFAITPPEFVKDGNPHEVEIYAIDHPAGTPKLLAKRTIGVNSIFPGFWTSDRLLDTRVKKGLYITSVSTWFDAYHKGVRKGEVLQSYDGIATTTSAAFKKWLNEKKKKNEVAKFVIWRDGETYEVEVKMGQLSGA